MPTSKVNSDHVAQGIFLILISVFAMGFAEAIIKLVSSDLTVWQIFISRSIFAVICLVAFATISKKNTETA